MSRRTRRTLSGFATFIVIAAVAVGVSQFGGTSARTHPAGDGPSAGLPAGPTSDPCNTAKYKRTWTSDATAYPSTTVVGRLRVYKLRAAGSPNSCVSYEKLKHTATASTVSLFTSGMTDPQKWSTKRFSGAVKFQGRKCAGYSFSLGDEANGVATSMELGASGC